MVKFSRKEREIITDYLESINDLDYVLLRVGEEFPSKIEGGDIDILIKDLSEARKRALERNFSARRTSVIVETVRVGIKALKDPKRALNLLTKDPRTILNKTLYRDHANYKSINELQEEKFYKDKIIFHFTNHLAHKSTMNDSKIRIDPEVEEAFWENSKQINGFKVPDDPEKLIHRICRGIFDYNGDFPRYYKRECKNLLNSLNEAQRSRFEKHCERIFFAASDLIIEKTETSEFDSMREELLQFSSY